MKNVKNDKRKVATCGDLNTHLYNVYCIHTYTHYKL